LLFRETPKKNKPKKNEDLVWVLAVADQGFNPTEIVIAANEERYAKMMWTAHYGKK